MKKKHDNIVTHKYTQHEFIELKQNGKRESIVYYAPSVFDDCGFYELPLSDHYAFKFNPEGVETREDWVHASAIWNATVVPYVTIPDLTEGSK